MIISLRSVKKAIRKGINGHLELNRYVDRFALINQQKHQNAGYKNAAVSSIYYINPSNIIDSISLYFIIKIYEVNEKVFFPLHLFQVLLSFPFYVAFFFYLFLYYNHIPRDCKYVCNNKRVLYIQKKPNILFQKSHCAAKFVPVKFYRQNFRFFSLLYCVYIIHPHKT